jgi:Pyruvate/2-oxoacid:ferredoxin oxidoreductase delta subunit
MKNKTEKQIDKRVKELEKKACANCWEYCYEQGLDEKEKKEYDHLVYGEPK